MVGLSMWPYSDGSKTLLGRSAPKVQEVTPWLSEWSSRSYVTRQQLAFDKS
jgi:hypothetical protein